MAIGHFQSLVEGFPQPHGLDGLGVGIALGAFGLDGRDLELVGLDDDFPLSGGALKESLHFFISFSFGGVFLNPPDTYDYSRF